jgi:hypothetical protein
LSFGDTPSGPHDLVGAFALRLRPDDHAALRRDDDAVAPVSHRIILRRSDSALQRCKTLFSSAGSPERFSEIFARRNKRGFALTPLL